MAAAKAGPTINHISFNQDQGCFVTALSDGFRVFSKDPLTSKRQRDFVDGGLGHAEMLFRCNYLALVGGGKLPLYPTNKVMIWDDRKNSVVIELPFKSEVRSVRLRRDRIVVALETKICIFTFTQSPQKLHTFITCDNPKGLCVLCPHNNNSLLVFPGQEKGQVQMVNLADAKMAPSIIAAHEAALACISLSQDGSLLATASEKGTLIRIFDTKTGQKKYEVRRGKKQATINCINFSPDLSMIVVSSNHSTIHVFELEDDSKKNIFMQTQSFSKFNVPSPYSVCVFSSDGENIIAVCGDGSYFKFSIRKEKDNILDKQNILEAKPSSYKDEDSFSPL